MAYVQPSEKEIERLKESYEEEKGVLETMEAEVEFHINNIELGVQRSKVRRIKDKLLMAASYDDFLDFNKTVCAFPVDEDCEGKIKHTFFQWFIYGNCCKSCSRKYNRNVQIMDEEPMYIFNKDHVDAWEGLDILDEKEVIHMTDNDVNV